MSDKPSEGKPAEPPDDSSNKSTATWTKLLIVLVAALAYASRLGRRPRQGR